MSTFLLYIRLGNEAMRTAENLAQALERIAADVRSPRSSAPFAQVDEDGNLEAGWYQTIHDVNGNDVGRYAVKNEVEEAAV